MPYGRDFGVGGVSSLISPVFGSSRPTRLPFCAVNHRIPPWSKISVWGSRTSWSGIPYSVTAPVLGSSLPIKPALFAVYQMLPPRSSTRPWGPEWGVLSGYSLNRPVFGSSRPSTLAIWPVYQSDPSAVASGSCGRDPGVGTCHSFIETFTGPGITMPAGFGFSGKFLARYAVIVASWSGGIGTPRLIIIRITVRHPAAVYPAPTRAESAWQLLHWAATSSLPGPSGNSWLQAGNAELSRAAAAKERHDCFSIIPPSARAARSARGPRPLVSARPLRRGSRRDAARPRTGSRACRSARPGRLPFGRTARSRRRRRGSPASRG